ncbi:MAG: hypothetical protein ACJ763_17790 [Bdellovibrionia bacterium]
MVPIYESDVAEERWSKTEWNHYELWEKVEQRIRRYNRLWIAATVFVFLLLSSVPIVMDQYPHWTALAATRRLGQEVDHMKREAAMAHVPYRIRFLKSDVSGVSYQVEKVDQCSSPQGTIVRTGALVSASQVTQYMLLSRQMGESLSIPGLLEEYCYDPLRGSDPAARGENVSGFAVMPVKDLADHRADRIAVLLLTGPSAELSFE